MWQAVRDQPPGERYLILNADGGEPATFKDREVLQRRPDLVLEELTGHRCQGHLSEPELTKRVGKKVQLTVKTLPAQRRITPSDGGH